jgi:hypothetical protein
LIASGAVIEGVLTSSEGRIGGFNITSQSLFSTGNEVVLDSANHQISLKTSTFGNDGVQLSASGDFHMGDATRFITLQNNSLGIKTDTFNLDTTTFDVTTDNGGRVDLGDGIQLSGSGEGYVANQSMGWDSSGNLQLTASKVDISGSDVRIQTPSFFFGDATNFISSSNNGLDIRTGEATLSGSSVTILSPNFLLGSKTSHISGSATGLSIKTGEAVLSGSSVEILTPNFFLGELGTSFISSSTSQIEISSSNFHLSSEGNVTMSGEITAEAGKIAGWKISGSSIQTGSGFFGVQLDHVEGLIGRGQEAHEFLGGVGDFYFSPAGHPQPPNLPDGAE